MSLTTSSLRLLAARILACGAILVASCQPASSAIPTAVVQPTAIGSVPLESPVTAAATGLPATYTPSPAPSSRTPDASPSATASPAAGVPTATPGGTPSSSGDWPTYHRDAARYGVDASLGSFAQILDAWRAGPLDGDIYAEPLVVAGRVLVATENNSVYGLGLETGRQVWRTHLGPPVPRSALPCGNIDPTGITSTPVVDVTSGTLFAVTFIQPGHHELVAIDLASGAVRFRAPIDPPGADPLVQQQRAALAASGGLVYVAFGGLWGDCGQYHGWVIAADAADGAIRSTYRVPTEREGGIWAPSGPSIDATGSLFVATGNGSSTSSTRFDCGNAVLRLSPDLRLVDWFAPADWVDLNRRDGDLGTTSPTILDDGLIFQVGKAGIGYLLRAGQLGQVGGEIYQARVCGSAFGGTAYRPPVVYVPCTDGLVAVRVAGNSFAVDWTVPGIFAGPPIVAGGAVWTLTRDGILYAVDPTDGHVLSRTSVGSVTHFATPSVSGPYLLIPATREVVALRMR